MAVIGYHASHEQFAPGELLKLAVLAEKAGFKSVSSSDHFHPWSMRQGQSGYSFSWLGAAMQATQLPFMVVASAGQRQHPAIVAQAAATLAEMFPGRFTLALGSGEALNESITGEPWPEKPERNRRLHECYEVIQQLLNGEVVNHSGLITVKHARLYTLPSQLPDLVCAAVSEATAGWFGSWANSLLTTSKPFEDLQKIIDAFRKGGGEGKPMYLKVQLSYSRSEEEALEGAYDQWRTNILPESHLPDLSTTEQFDEAAESVTPEDLKKMIHVSSKPDEYIEWIKKYMDMGFDGISLHNVNRNQEQFINDFGEKVLKHL